MGGEKLRRAYPLCDAIDKPLSYGLISMTCDDGVIEGSNNVPRPALHPF